MPLILKIVPFIIVIALGILFLIPCIILWICMCSPKCCCRKKSRITKPFNCLIILFSNTGVSIIFFSIVIAFLKSSEKGLHGTLCTLSMLTYDIVQGVGLLKKTEFDKPHWYGLTAIDNLVAATNIMLTSLTPNCTNFLSHMKAPFGTGSGTNDPNYTNILIDFPDKIVQVYSNVMSPSTPNTITMGHNPSKGASTPSVTITPLYIKSLGPPSDKSTDLGKILTDFKKNYENVIENIILNMTIQCRAILNPTVSASFSSSIGKISGITGDLGPAMESLSGDIIDQIDKYKGLIINYLFKSFLAFNIITMIFITYEAGFMLFYSYRNYNIIRNNLICVWAFIGFLLIILLIFTAIFGIIGTLISDMGDIVDFLFSNENISSENPRIIGGSNLGNINTCLRGDGDLLSVFLDSSTREFTNAIDILFNMYYPIMHTYDLVNSDTPNNLNILESLTTLEEYYENVEEDFTLATSSSVHGELDVSKQITEFNKYTTNNGVYSKSCTKNDYYASTQSKCPTNGSNVCKILTESSTNTNPYSSDTSCSIDNGYPYTYLNDVGNSFINYFLDFIGSYSTTPFRGNKGLIRNLKNLIFKTTDPNSLLSIYKQDISYLKASLDDLKKTIDVVYNAYADYVNVEALKNGSYVSVFSWLNCTVFGKDINATLNIMKKGLRKDLRIIFFISLTNNCLIIGIMVVATFLLNWYKFDPLENNPVGEMEIVKKMNRFNKDFIYSEGLSSSNNSDKNSNNSDRTNRIFFKNKKKMIDDQSLKSQFGDQINNPSIIKVKNDNQNNENNMIKPNNNNKKNNLNNSSDSQDTFQLDIKKKLTMNKNKHDEADNPIIKINNENNV